MKYTLELHEEQVSVLFYALMSSLENKVGCCYMLGAKHFWRTYRIEDELLKQLSAELDKFISYNNCVNRINDRILEKKSNTVIT